MKPTQISIVAAITVSLSLSVLAQLSVSRVLTVDVAETIARGALEKCRAEGYHATVLVVDSLNAPKVMMRDDGATASTTEVAKLKATSAMLYNRPSGAGTLPGTIAAAGGVPIKVGDQTIGAIGISATPGGAGASGKDVECANAGLAKVADKLK